MRKKLHWIRRNLQRKREKIVKNLRFLMVSFGKWERWRWVSFSRIFCFGLRHEQKFQPIKKEFLYFVCCFSSDSRGFFCKESRNLFHVFLFQTQSRLLKYFQALKPCCNHENWKKKECVNSKPNNFMNYPRVIYISKIVLWVYHQCLSFSCRVFKRRKFFVWQAQIVIIWRSWQVWQWSFLDVPTILLSSGTCSSHCCYVWIYNQTLGSILEQFIEHQNHTENDQNNNDAYDYDAYCAICAGRSFVIVIVCF